ncbi:COG3608 Predicted deacylase [Rhabdaerophilaceae bacterium]
MKPSPVACSIDLAAPGKHVGHLLLSWSNVAHAYGVIPVPIAVIARGEGPTVLVSAGVHGDEYEGLAIARRLIAEIGPKDITGRLIVMPAMNLPAVRARIRTSPIDNVNLNRAFPGGHDGPSGMIADFVERRILPQCQYALDLHSGGTQSIYVPCGYIYQLGTEEFRAKKLAAAHAFGAPWTVTVAATSSGGSLSAAAERHGVVLVATELAGGAILDREALRIGWDGTLNFLRYAGVLAGPIEATRTSLRKVAGATCYVMATMDGLFEPTVEIGDEVEVGEIAGRIWPMDDLTRQPEIQRFSSAGTVICKRTMPMVIRGDYLFHTGSKVSDASFITDNAHRSTFEPTPLAGAGGNAPMD